MKLLIEQLQQQNALLFLGHAAVQEDRFAAAGCELARLPFRRVVTLGQAPHLLAAWRLAGRSLDVVPLGDIPPRLDESRVTWLALPAGPDKEPAWLTPMLRTWFAAHTVCLLGCDLEDEGFRRRFVATAHALGPHRHTYQAVVPHPLAEGDREYWAAHKVRCTLADPMVWAGQLAEAWSQVSRAESDPGGSTARRDGRPYRFLDSYTEAEAGSFFGRDAAIRDLGERVLAERLVLCFGPSGVGKTSLLQAGLVPRLRGQGCLPLYSRPGSDPVREIRRAIISTTGFPPVENRRSALGQEAARDGPESLLEKDLAWKESLSGKAQAPVPGAVQDGRGRSLEGDSLAESLAALAQQAGRTVVVLLDQFEEVFTLLGGETVTRLAAELAACLRLPGGEVHVVLSLREDYLAHLHLLQPHLAAVYAHRFRLRPLDREQAREAIERPAHLFRLAYEPGLTEQLLDDLRREDGQVEPSDLQIVCDALYDDLQDRQAGTFTLARYRELGGAPQLLGGYLERVVAGEAAPDGVRATLKAMVTAAGARALLPAAEIARLAGLDEEVTVEILRRLDRPHRLVRPLRQEGAVQHELAHEVLGPRILAWIEDPAEREAKAAHDLLRAELHNWRTFGVLPHPGKLRAVHTQRDNAYLHLGPAEVELMARGAVRHDLDPAAWLARAEAAGVPGGEFLLPALAAPHAEVRRQAVHLLGPEQALAELARLLRDPDAAARARAAATLGGMDEAGARRLLRRARHDPARAVRDTVWEALEAVAPRAAARLRRRDEMAPLLAAGSLVYWLLLALAWQGRLAPDAGPGWALAGGLWLVALLVLERLIPGPRPRLLAWPGLVTSGGLLIARWGWLKGGAALLLLLWLGGDLRNRPYLALAALLPYLLLLGLVEATAAHVLAIAGGQCLILSLLALTVPRWGRRGADRLAALALLGAGLGAVAGGLLAGGDAVALGTGLLLGTASVIGRGWARRPLTHSDRATPISANLSDLGKALWDYLDRFSPRLKPLLGGVLGAGWAALLLRAAAGLSPGSAPAWDIGDALLLGAGLGLGLWWAKGGLLRALLLPALGGAAGGALAQGWSGGLMGAGIGLGLGLGEWLAARSLSAGHEGTPEA